MKRQILIISIILVSIQTLSLAVVTRHVPSLQYPKIQDAINASSTGDTVLILPGRHRIHDASTGDWTQMVVASDITIRSLNPDDPCTVAGTVIEGGFWIWQATRNMVINGLTIEGRYYGYRDGCNGGNTASPCDFNVPRDASGKYTGDTIDPNNANKWIPGDPNGQNGWSVEGGGMRLEPFASPTVTNCVFNNCVAMGRNGGDGSQRGWGGWAGWGHGGAVYIGLNGKPLFKNCDFIDCYAIGGDGGNNTSAGGRGGSWGSNNEPMGDPATGTGWKWAPAVGYGEIWKYSGLGGAVYCNEGSEPVFDNCNFVNNRAIGGSCGISDPTIPRWPQQHYKIERHGGAVFCDANSAPDFNNCTFIGNEPDPNNDNEYTVNNHKNGPGVADNPYIGFGGAVAYEGGAAPKFTNCIFNGNTANAGGAAFNESGAGQFSGCNFSSNSALVGGGICMVNSTDIIATSQISQNQATIDSGAGGGIYVLGGNVAFTDSAISDNTAASGGGVFIDSGITTLFRNCLITGNSANSDGGGISTTWESSPTIANCTIADNSVSGAGGYGGGVNVAYGSFAQIINSIIWGNSAVNGDQIAIGSNGLPPDANIIVSYSNVQDGAAGVYFYTGVSPRYLQWDYISNLTGLSDPLFIAGYYLSQPSTGDPIQQALGLSPCVDKGSTDANKAGMYRYTTQTDNVPEEPNSIVDMGYHHILNSALLGDFDYDGDVDNADFELFGLRWLHSGCSFPDWCDGSDLNQDGTVNLDDYNIFAANWGKKDTTPPSPDPMTWAVPPYSSGPSSISMTATTAFDNSSGSNVQYKFQRTDANGNPDGSVGNPDGIVHDWNDRGSSSPTFTDSNHVVSGRQYGYRVRARDMSDNHNETDWSVIGYAEVSVAGTPIAPSGLTATPVSATQINLSWTDNSSNETGFKIERKTGTGSFSQIATVGAGVQTYNNTGLTAATTYSYQVYAYNGSGNSAYSNTASATTPAEGNEPNLPTTLPTPVILYNPPPAVPVDGNNSGQTKIDPNGNSSNYWWHKIVTPIQVTPVVYYRVYCTSQSGFSSQWLPSNGTGNVVYPPITQGDPNPVVKYINNTITYCVPVTMGSTGINLNWRVDVSFNPDGSGTQNHSSTKTIQAP